MEGGNYQNWEPEIQVEFKPEIQEIQEATS